MSYYLNQHPYAAHRLILIMIGKNPGRILDAGCASGYLGPFYRQLGANYLVGLENNKNQAAKARKFYDKTFVVDLNQLDNIQSLPIVKNSFDTLVCADILEHLVSPLATLKKLALYLKPKGQLIVSLPNVTFFINRLKILLGKFEYDQIGGIMDATHLRFFNRQTAIELVKNAGFDVVKLDHSRLGKLGWIKLLPNFFGVQIIIKARKRTLK